MVGMTRVSRIVLLIALLSFLSSVCSASMVKVNVPMKVQGSITGLNYEVKNGVLKLNVEFFNSGSVPYNARFRLYVYNTTNFPISWSNEQSLMPGDRKNYEIYWYVGNLTGKLNANLRAYYGNEILDYNFSFNTNGVTNRGDIFKIKNFRVYEDYVRFELRSNKSVNDVIIVPSGYVISWIVEQAKVEKLNKNRGVEVFLPYHAPEWTVGRMTIQVFTEDGLYYKTETFSLHKETGIWKYIHYIIDGLSLYFNF